MRERLDKLCDELRQTGDRLEREGDRELADAHRTMAQLIEARPLMACGRSSFRRQNGTEVRILDNGRVVHRASGLPSGVQTRAKATGRPGASRAADLADLADALGAAVDENYQPRRAQPAERRVYLGRDENGRERWGTVEMDDDAFDDLDFSVIED